MAEFYVSLSDDQIASQIATLLNLYNKLYRTHTADTIKNSNSNYFVEINRNEVVGCAGMLQESPMMSKIYHISVKPEVRGKGVAKKLVCLALIHCPTEQVYMTVREDNLASLRLAYTLGFVPLNKTWSRDHYIITVGRKRV